MSPCLERRRGFLICGVALNWVALFDIFPTLKDAAERNAVKRGQTAAGRGCCASSDAACESVTAEVCVCVGCFSHVHANNESLHPNNEGPAEAR